MNASVAVKRIIDFNVKARALMVAHIPSSGDAAVRPSRVAEAGATAIDGGGLSGVE